ncbi:MAG: hypothetical protein J1D99_00295 [Campylobacter sp.]|nr:hypothetical protein [Campylobacter sp.]
MSRLDGLKEDLKSLRFWLGIVVASFLAIISWLAANYSKTELWLIISSCLLLLIFAIIVFLINKKMRKIIKKIYETKKEE